MAVRTEDLVAQLKQQILAFQAPTRTVDVGTVLSVGDGIARLSGLTNARASELVEFDNGTLGIVFNLEADNVGVIIMGETTGIAEGQIVRSTGRIVSVPVGKGTLGRVFNLLGDPVDGRGEVSGAIHLHGPAGRTGVGPHRARHPADRRGPAQAVDGAVTDRPASPTARRRQVHLAVARL